MGFDSEPSEITLFSRFCQAILCIFGVFAAIILGAITAVFVVFCLVLFFGLLHLL